MRSVVSRELGVVVLSRSEAARAADHLDSRAKWLLDRAESTARMPKKLRQQYLALHEEVIALIGKIREQL